MKFCSCCGSRTYTAIPAGDNRERSICSNDQCGVIHYQNPKIITGCLPISGDKVLLCKRAIEPRYGLWTLPAGFMENAETTEQGALRESWEEAKANLRVEHLYGLFNLPYINQVYFFYKAELIDNNFSAGEESLDVKLFSEDEIPWDDLAFTVIHQLLKHYFNDRKMGHFPLHTDDIIQAIKP